MGIEDSLYAAEVLADQHFGAVGIYDTDEAGTIEQLEQVCDVVLRELDELDIDKFFTRRNIARMDRLSNKE